MRVIVPLFTCLFYACGLISAESVVSTRATVARWCTISPQEQQKCEDMKAAFQKEELSPPVECINAGSRKNCIYSIAKGYSDLVTLDGGDVYTGGEKYNIRPIMEEVYDNGNTGYYAIGVVRKSNSGVTINNLKNKKSCHTGYGRTAGWNIPVGFLLETAHMPSVGCQNSLASAAAFFNQSCVPGALSEDVPEGVDVRNLCALCDAPLSCSKSDDVYASYEGAFRCLVEQNADVAFIKPETVLDNTDGNNQQNWAAQLRSDDFEILCRDGTRQPITNAASCHIARSPSHAVVTSESKVSGEIDTYVKLLQNAVNLFGVDGNARGFSLFDSEGGADLLFKDTTQSLGTLDVDDYQDFLGEEYLGSLDGLLSCPAGTIRFCTISNGEQEKCYKMRDNFAASKLPSNMSCFQTESHTECIQAIAAGKADLVTLDSGDIYQAGKYSNLVPVMGETYGEGDASYWAVAVVKANTNFNINDLEGKKSCHTGIMKTSGWIVPIGFLTENNKITVNHCNAAEVMGEYFSQSCVPGALEDEYNPYGNNPDSLCDLCIGQGDYNCVRNDHEPYYDYSGAFRCLVENAGEVAFVKHLTVDDNVNPAEPENWNQNLRKDDYAYLCPDGTRQIDWTEDCSLSKVSSHALMTSEDKTENFKSKVRTVFSQAQNLFTDDSTTFKLFDSASYEGSDLLFKDATISLQDVGNKDTYDTWLSAEYIKGVEALDPAMCSGLINQMAAFMLVAVLVIAQVLFGGA